MKIPYPLSTYDGKLDPKNTDHEIWVKSTDSAAKIARRVVDLCSQTGRANVATMGDRSANQAHKGIAVARQMWRDMGHESDLYCAVWFSSVIDARDENRTRIVLGVFIVHDDLMFMEFEPEKA